MDTLKECNVVMLPTEKATRGMIAKCIKDDSSNTLDRIGNLCIIENDRFYKPNIYWQPQHLYITSNDEIKEGDNTYCKQFGLGTIKLINSELCYVTNPEIGKGSITTPYKRNLGNDCKKIIATTDKAILLDKSSPDGKTITWKETLPEPSQSFIKKYCELGGIDKGMVEYEVDLDNPPEGYYKCIGYGKYHEDEPYLMKSLGDSPDREPNYKLKVNPKDNTITIKPTRRLY